ncbi:hypothetical protein [Nocardia sp. NPDC049149]|uniref:hypothetical protein n=1 Tax=Nocardia sp. NPDC049149 TaxID=3364315 RepID=UPI00371F4383
MSPDYRRQDELSTQDTDVFPAYSDDHEPFRSRRQPARKRQWIGRYALTGLAALLVGSVIVVGGLAAGGYFTKSADEGTTAVTTTAKPPSTTSAKAAPLSPPAAGAPLSTVMAWVRAGTPADIAKFHTATAKSGTVSDLGSAVAFVSPSEKIRCMTSASTKGGQGLTCMAELDNPPSRPAKAKQGNWVGGWIEFPGPTLGIGSVRGDPGQFTLGDGASLPYGSRLTFDDYDCRMDETGLFCVNNTAGSAIQLSSAGAVPFGCLGKVEPKDNGLAFSCNTFDTTATSTPSSTSTADHAAVGSPCDSEDAGSFRTAKNGKELLCSAGSDRRSYRWTDPGPLASGTNEDGEVCDRDGEKYGKSSDGSAVICRQTGSSTWRWQSTS